MKLKQIASNMTELSLEDGTIVLFSYDTPVAAIGVPKLGVIKTNKKWSRTTSKHINKWFSYEYTGAPTDMYKAFNVQEVEQEVLDQLVRSA